jgi:two-component system sensor histidine kinase TctE
MAEISVRRLLFRWLLAPSILVLAIAAAAGYRVTLHSATTAYDGALLDGALSLAQLLRVSGEAGALSLSRSADILLRTDKYDRIYYSVRNTEGKLIVGDETLPLPPASFSSGELLYDSRVGDERVRVAALAVEMPGSRFIVQVAETTVKRRKLVAETLTALVVSEGLFMAAVIALVWLGIGRGLAPLQRLRQEIEARSHRDLRPVQEDQAPVEVRPVVHALNNLLLQLAATLRAQQQFVANAAHQLRTPLAGLRMQAEYGLQQREPAEWQRVLVTLKLATERTAHLANQLLTLARTESGNLHAESMRPTDLRAVVERVTEEFIPRAIAKRIDLGLELDAAVVNGDELLIGELLSNLFDNAIAYAREAGRITIRTRLEAGAAALEIEDDGPGIAFEERQKVFGRFYRVEGSPGEGCGLGLAIVREIAHLHGASVGIETAASGSGTLIAVRFPAAGSATESVVAEARA